MVQRRCVCTDLTEIVGSDSYTHSEYKAKHWIHMEPQDTIHCNVYMYTIEYLHMFPYMNQLKAKSFICECVNFESG